MSVSKETIMQTLNLDETDDTALIPAYIESAQQYIINAWVVIRNSTTSKVWNLYTTRL